MWPNTVANEPESELLALGTEIEIAVSDCTFVFFSFEYDVVCLFSAYHQQQLHVLQTFFLPESPEVQYNFRPRSHDKLLIPKTADLSERDFIIRLLYKDCYFFLHITCYRFILFLLC